MYFVFAFSVMVVVITIPQGDNVSFPKFKHNMDNSVVCTCSVFINSLRLSGKKINTLLLGAILCMNSCLLFYIQVGAGNIMFTEILYSQWGYCRVYNSFILQ